jgi:hypothetical protein
MMNTNNLGDATAWMPIPNSMSTNQAFIPFDLTQGNAFFRLIYP